MLAQDIHARLRAALPAEVPVLLPEEIEVPRGGRRPGEAGGISAYLAAHPQGYVQVEEAQPIASDGTTATYWIPVASVAPDAGACAALAAGVNIILNGPPDEPAPFQEVLPDQPRAVQAGVFLCRPTYEALTIAGQSAG